MEMAKIKHKAHRVARLGYVFDDASEDNRRYLKLGLKPSGGHSSQFFLGKKTRSLYKNCKFMFWAKLNTYHMMYPFCPIQPQPQFYPGSSFPLGVNKLGEYLP